MKGNDSEAVDTLDLRWSHGTPQWPSEWTIENARPKEGKSGEMSAAGIFSHFNAAKLEPDH